MQVPAMIAVKAGGCASLSGRISPKENRMAVMKMPETAPDAIPAPLVNCAPRIPHKREGRISAARERIGAIAAGSSVLSAAAQSSRSKAIPAATEIKAALRLPIRNCLLSASLGEERCFAVVRVRRVCFGVFWGAEDLL